MLSLLHAKHQEPGAKHFTFLLYVCPAWLRTETELTQKAHRTLSLTPGNHDQLQSHTQPSPAQPRDLAQTTPARCPHSHPRLHTITGMAAVFAFTISTQLQGDFYLTINRYPIAVQLAFLKSWLMGQLHQCFCGQLLDLCTS